MVKYGNKKIRQEKRFRNLNKPLKDELMDKFKDENIDKM
jgi:hypothetical protein